MVVPDRFLRAWDPVTVFFDRDPGPPAGGPEDDAERFVRLAPAHPGAFTWLDARTLQFRPPSPGRRSALHLDACRARASRSPP